MGHHASESPFENFGDNREKQSQFSKLLDELNLASIAKHPLDLGPTGTYPDGKIAE